MSNKNRDLICNCCYCGANNDLMLIKEIEKEVIICKECRCNYNLQTEKDILDEFLLKIKKPNEIVELLNEVIIGQDEAKKMVAIEIYNHFLRILNKSKLKSSQLNKNNIMLTGPTGTGKTLMAKTLSEILEVPFVTIDAKTLTDIGYKGGDVESILYKLLLASNMNVNKAKYGIIYIDEIDKLARKDETSSNIKDISGEGVQESLLTLIEGTTVSIPVSVGEHKKEIIDIDTSNILFICGGAFDGIEDIIKRRLKILDNGQMVSNAHGFPVMKKALNSYEFEKAIRNEISNIDLNRYGFIPELVGRFPVLCNFNPLNKIDLINILKMNNGLINEYKALLEIQGKTLVITDNCFNKIAELSLMKKVGARGLRAIVYSAMKEIMYNAPIDEKTEYLLDENSLTEL